MIEILYDELMHYAADLYGTVTLGEAEDYLEHHGIKGQKWGVRRYQNEDGTLTEAGKARYSDPNFMPDKQEQKEARDAIKAEYRNYRSYLPSYKQTYKRLLNKSKSQELSANEQEALEYSKKLIDSGVSYKQKLKDIRSPDKSKELFKEYLNDKISKDSSLYEINKYYENYDEIHKNELKERADIIKKHGIKEYYSGPDKYVRLSDDLADSSSEIKYEAADYVNKKVRDMTNMNAGEYYQGFFWYESEDNFNDFIKKLRAPKLIVQKEFNAYVDSCKKLFSYIDSHPETIQTLNTARGKKWEDAYSKVKPLSQDTVYYGRKLSEKILDVSGITNFKEEPWLSNEILELLQ